MAKNFAFHKFRRRLITGLLAGGFAIFIGIVLMRWHYVRYQEEIRIDHRYEIEKVKIVFTESELSGNEKAISSYLSRLVREPKVALAGVDRLSGEGLYFSKGDSPNKNHEIHPTLNSKDIDPNNPYSTSEEIPELGSVRLDYDESNIKEMFFLKSSLWIKYIAFVVILFFLMGFLLGGRNVGLTTGRQSTEE